VASAFRNLGEASSKKLRSGMWNWALGLGVLAAIAFLAFPAIDLAVSRQFHSDYGAFVGQSLGWVKGARWVFAILFYFFIAAVIAGLFLTRRHARTWLGLASAQWLFLAICLAAGPGLVANVVFKDHWGRARPKQVIEFGGSRMFTRALIPSRECDRNCSFIGGEAASLFLPFYAGSLVMPQSAALLLVSGTLLGLAAGLVRIAQGAHFLSDIVFAGVFMALTVVAVHSIMFRRDPRRAAHAKDASPVQARELTSAARIVECAPGITTVQTPASPRA
jgi:lipid A 4'-phosphatase